MIDINVFFAEYGIDGIAYSEYGSPYEVEKYLIERGFVILKLDGRYIHFYDPSKAKEYENELEGVEGADVEKDEE